MTADCCKSNSTQCQYRRGYIADLLSTDYSNILPLALPCGLLFTMNLNLPNQALNGEAKLPSLVG